MRPVGITSAGRISFSRSERSNDKARIRRRRLPLAALGFLASEEGGALGFTFRSIRGALAFALFCGQALGFLFVSPLSLPLGCTLFGVELFGFLPLPALGRALAR